MQGHKRVVQEIQKQVITTTEMVSFSSTNTSNTLRKRPNKGVDLSSLNRIIEITSKWAIVEPRVTFLTLCTETFKQKLLPPVVPEFTSITVGGAVMGAALESSSHQFGQVNDICLEYEVVLGNGESIRVSPEENADLFYGLSGSYGTLGILTLIKLRLIEAKKYVHLTFNKIKTNELLSYLTTNHSVDYIEGIALNREEGVAITGKMQDQPTSPIYRQNHYWSPWYIQHITENPTYEAYVPTLEYLFRFDRGAFWMGQYTLSIWTMIRLLFHLGIPKISRDTRHPSLLFRLLFGWALSSQRLYRVWHQIPKQISENLFFVHDFYTPFSKVNQVFESFVEQTEIFPIWLCPIKGTDKPQILAPHFGNSHLLNIGLYGMPNSSLSTPALSAKLEKEITQLGGRKMLYSYTYYDKESFSTIYDETSYQALRDKFFAAKAFPHIYNKVVI